MKEKGKMAIHINIIVNIIEAYIEFFVFFGYQIGIEIIYIRSFRQKVFIT